jgi:BioD-like phosphotransacetylase family protein
VANSAKHLLIASTEGYSGKSGTILGLGTLLQKQGLKIAYGKPLGTTVTKETTETVEEDVRFIADHLNLGSDLVRSPLLYLDESTITQALQGREVRDYTQALQEYFHNTEADLILLEGGTTLAEGSLFNLSVSQMAQITDAKIILVARYHSLLLTDSILTAKQFLGDRLVGILINDVPLNQLEKSQTLIKPFLEQHQIKVFGIIPQDRLLRSVSVRELSHRLEAKVLCRGDRLDLMVESLTIGAMNVNSALEYFRQGVNMAVVTGGDRTDLQLAALETSTQCLILTGHVPPQPLILSRAEDLEIPILAVDFDTLTTVEIVDQAFGVVRLQEPIKVQKFQELIAKYFDLPSFLTELELKSYS